MEIASSRSPTDRIVGDDSVAASVQDWWVCGRCSLEKLLLGGLWRRFMKVMAANGKTTR